MQLRRGEYLYEKILGFQRVRDRERQNTVYLCKSFDLDSNKDWNERKREKKIAEKDFRILSELIEIVQ